jgi:TolB protein
MSSVRRGHGGGALGPRSTARPSSNGLIAFASNGDIWVTDVDDTSRIQLTSGPSWDSSPIWSPQGDRIAYWTQRTPVAPFVLMVMDADGSNPTKLRDLTTERLGVTDGFPPVWRPDGIRIAYSVDDGERSFIETVDVESAQHQRLTGGRYPAWSPDGAMIAFQGGLSSDEIWTMAADGSSAQRLTTGFGPVWSSMGQIAYYDGQSGANDIWVMNADGTDAANITNSADDEYWPSWSPDGSLIAFDRATEGFSSNDIVVAAPDGSGAVTLQGESVTGGAPVWSPDGTLIEGTLFNAQDGEYGLEIYDVRGSDPGRSIPADGHTGYDSWQALR